MFSYYRNINIPSLLPGQAPLLSLMFTLKAEAQGMAGKRSFSNCSCVQGIFRAWVDFFFVLTRAKSILLLLSDALVGTWSVISIHVFQALSLNMVVLDAVNKCWGIKWHIKHLRHKKRKSLRFVIANAEIPLQSSLEMMEFGPSWCSTIELCRNPVVLSHTELQI